MQDREFQEFRTTRVTGGGYKGIPNGLKQSRPGKLCVFTLLHYTVLLMSNQDKCVIQYMQ